MPDAGEKINLKVPEQMNLAELIIDRGAELYGDKTALVCVGSREMNVEKESVSYADLKELISRAAKVLLELEIGWDDRVLIVLPDSVEFYLAFYGAIKLGAVPVPVNTYLTYRDYLYFLNDSRAKVAIVHGSFEEAVRACSDAKFLKDFMEAGEFRGRVNSEEVSADFEADFEAVRLSRDAVAFWLYSSGTTGKPKGVVHLQHDPVFVCESYHRRVLGLNRNDVCYSVSKLFFAYGLGSCGYGSLYFGATAIIDPERPDPDRSMEIMAKHGVTVLFTVPSFYKKLLDVEMKNPDLRLRMAVSGGEPLPAEIWYRFTERFGVEIVEHIGSTEACYAFIGNYPGKCRPGYTGVVLPGWEVKLVDDRGNEVDEGQPGRLLVKGESVAAFYWEKHDKSKKTFMGEWYDTGDVFVKEGAYYRYLGRADDMIKTRGLWVSPVHVEAALVKHHAVEQCAVVQGFNDDRLEVVAAYIVPRKSETVGEESLMELINEFKQFLRKEGLKGYQIPEKWVFVKSLPATATGKIRRSQLRLLEWEKAFGTIGTGEMKEG